MSNSVSKNMIKERKKSHYILLFALLAYYQCLKQAYYKY